MGPIAFTCESLTFPDWGASTIALHYMSQPEECAFSVIASSWDVASLRM